MKHFKLSFLLLAMLLLNFACVEEKETGDQAPVLPPASSMEIDFGAFPENPEGGRVAVSEYVNLGNAVTNVAVWNVIVGVHLIVPVAAFKKASEQTPVFDEDNSMWVWTYSFAAGSITYTAELTAKFVQQGVQWDMYISKSGEFEEVHWFSGISNLTGTEGEWNLNYLPHNPTPFIKINWSRESDNSKAQVKYTNVIPEHEYNGSYVEYGIDKSLELDAYYNIHLTKDNLDIEIQWSIESKFGKVKNFHFFEDDNFHCWDATGKDTVCE